MENTLENPGLLSLAKDGQRYRSLGCAPCAAKIESQAKSVPEIVADLEKTNVGERADRAQDQEDAHATRKLRKDGYT